MSYLTLAFAHDRGDWISRVMAWLTHSDVSHVALVRGGLVIEATGVGHPPHGVKVSLFEDWKIAHPGFWIKRIPHPSPDQVWAHAENQIGQPYDWTWLLRWLLRRDWRDNGKWVCSELIAWAAEQTGWPLVVGALASVTPRDLNMLT